MVVVGLGVGYRGGGKLVYILPQGQGGKGTYMIYIHTHDIQGYIGHTTTNLQSAIAVTDSGTTRDVIPV